MRLLLSILTCTFAFAPPGTAAEMVRVRGGGAAHTDCMLVTDVVGAAAAGRGRTVRCTDGDPVCDADRQADGVCTFSVRICLDDPTALRCQPAPLAHADLLAPVPALAGLAAAVHAISMPVVAPDTCTVVSAVPVTTRGRRRGRVVLRATATPMTGPVDRDRLSLACRPGSPLAPLSTVQEKVFTPSCSSASCHGDARAGGLDLRPEASPAALINVLATNEDARAGGLLRVVPGNPDASFLMHKLIGPLPRGRGAIMPRAGVRLPERRLGLVRRWIAGLPTP